MDREFEKLLKSFSHKYCMEFEASDENKLCYTQIFKEYQSTIEAYLMNQLSKSISDFSMEFFSKELE